MGDLGGGSGSNDDFSNVLIDYRARLYRKDPSKPMRQVVIYLKQTGSELVHQTSFTMERTRHEFDVIRL
jgi:predicted transposase YdaD